MAGTLILDTIKSSTTSPPAFQNTNGTAIGTLCRAWVNFDGTTSPGTIRASFNVSSVTKNGTGDYTVNFTNAMPDANYSVISTTRIYTISFSGSDVITTSAVRLENWYASSTAGGRTNLDPTYAFVSIFR